MLVIAHRGASAFAQENTLQSFNLAFKLGSSWLETDVQRSSDGVLVLYHDYSLPNGKKIKELPYKELVKHNIPKLSDLLKITPENFTLNLEIKNDGNIYSNIEKEILEEIKKAKNIKKEHILISSFSVDSLTKIRALDKQISIGVLTRDFDVKIPLAQSIISLPALEFIVPKPVFSPSLDGKLPLCIINAKFFLPKTFNAFF